jgi:hypothetical protein
MVQIATTCDGLKTTDPKYRDGLYPWDTVPDANDMVRKQYKCALTCLMFLHAFGMELESDGLPYRLSFDPKKNKPKVYDAIVQMQRNPAWERVNAAPDPGEMSIMYMPGDPRLTHAFACARVEGDLLTSIDGGYGDIHLTTRRIVKIGRDLCLRDAQGDRVLLGILRVAKLLPTRNWFLPSP